MDKGRQPHGRTGPSPLILCNYHGLKPYDLLTSLRVMMLGLWMKFGEPVEKKTIPDTLITYDRLIHLEMGHDSVDEKGPC